MSSTQTRLQNPPAIPQGSATASQALPAACLGDAAQSIAARLFSDSEQQVEQLGAIFLACTSAAAADPEGAARAHEKQRLGEFLLPRVREQLQPESTERISGGWLGTFMAGDGRPVESGLTDTTDRQALDVCERSLQRAESIAEAEGNSTMLRNLGWYRARLAHKSYAAIASSEERVAATVRTGVARARKYLLRIVHELQNGQPAPLSGEAPVEIEPLRILWVEQDLERLAAELEATRVRHAEDPHWLNLAGLLAADRGRHDEALSHYEEGLIHADAPSVRARLLNNLGNLVQDQQGVENAEAYWRRAHQLLPHAPAPLLNLLAAASQRRDYADSQHHMSELGELLGSGRLSDAERAYVLRRLDENPELSWLRDTDAWRNGPLRWLRGARDAEQPGLRAAAAGVLRGAGVVLLTLALLLPGLAQAGTDGAATHERVYPNEPGVILVARDRGGDSMGKPPRRGDLSSPRLVAGDSMGRTARDKGRDRGRRGRG